MRNPKIKVTRNPKTKEYHFAFIAGNGESVLIGGETFKRKPTRSKLYGLAFDMMMAALENDIEYVTKTRSTKK